MKTYEIRFTRGWILGVLGLTLACITIALSGRSPAHLESPQARSIQEIVPTIVNKTAGLRVIAVEISSGKNPDVRLTLSNESGKNILAYVISVADSNIVTFSGLNGESFARGQTKVDLIPLGNLQSLDLQYLDRAPEVVVSAIYFENHTGEGDPQQLDSIKQRYAGIKVQLELALPVLQGALGRARSNSADAFSTLEADASHMPTEVENPKLSPDYRGGRAWVKENLKSEIQNLREARRANSNYDYSVDLRRLIDIYQQLLRKL